MPLACDYQACMSLGEPGRLWPMAPHLAPGQPTARQIPYAHSGPGRHREVGPLEPSPAIHRIQRVQAVPHRRHPAAAHRVPGSATAAVRHPPQPQESRLPNRRLSTAVLHPCC